jgi:dihydroorotate dehydrogenase (fumarate)
MIRKIPMQTHFTVDLSTKYMGLSLRNPLIIGSCGLTNSVEKVIELEKGGAGAVVLKSLFEEQINHQIAKSLSQTDSVYHYPEATDYISNYSKEHDISQYLDLIRKCKAAVKIPVIASINCISASEWIAFARKIQEAGADALELNIFILPSDPKRNSEQNEKVYFDIVMAVMKEISLPVAVKISPYFAGLANTALKLSWTGIAGMVLFNRFYSPDIDIKTMGVVPSHVLSTPEEMSLSLRWVAMLSDRVHCDIAASTGIGNGESVVKQLLAGAMATQVVSAIYKGGNGVIGEMLKTIEAWMKEKNFTTTKDFIGRMSLSQGDNPGAWERVQFMKHFSGIE